MGSPSTVTGCEYKRSVRARCRELDDRDAGVTRAPHTLLADYQNGQRYPNRRDSRPSNPPSRPAGTIASRSSGNKSSAGYCQR